MRYGEDNIYADLTSTFKKAKMLFSVDPLLRIILNKNMILKFLHSNYGDGRTLWPIMTICHDFHKSIMAIDRIYG